MATFRTNADDTSATAAAAARVITLFAAVAGCKKDDGRSDVASSKWPRLMSGKYRQSHKTSVASAAAAAPFTTVGGARRGNVRTTFLSSSARSSIRPKWPEKKWPSTTSMCLINDNGRWLDGCQSLAGLAASGRRSKGFAYCYCTKAWSELVGCTTWLTQLIWVKICAY